MRFKIADLLIYKDDRVEFITPIWLERKDYAFSNKKVYRVFFKIGNIHRLDVTLFKGLGMILNDTVEIFPLLLRTYPAGLTFQIENEDIDYVLDSIYKLERKVESGNYSTEIRFKFDKDLVKKKVCIDIL